MELVVGSEEEVVVEEFCHDEVVGLFGVVHLFAGLDWYSADHEHEFEEEEAGVSFVLEIGVI